MNNSSVLGDLFEKNAIRINNGKIFQTQPQLSSPISFDRIEGMLLGLCIGDSLGNTSEALFPQGRKERFGEICDYLPNKHNKDLKKGLPSDDTQLAMWTLDQINLDKGLIPDNLAKRFCSSRIFGIGSTVREFIKNYKDLKKKWFESGPHKAGNGALMRIAPIIIPHLRKPSINLWADTAIAAMVTHNDSASTSSCITFVKLLFEVMQITSIPKAEWWLNTALETLRDVETKTIYELRENPNYPNWTGTLSDFVEKTVTEAYKNNVSVVDACNKWYSGAYILETFPSVLYILMRYAHSFEEAIIRAVNDTKDNDSVASIVGAIMGALHGKKKIPSRWIENLSGRTTGFDDGRVFQIIEDTKRIWFE
ncbi:MAG: ADP-ribosylglycohydrolase family protein [Candidatus Riflebacteria bacterium]|nr:ADP-ribosylglycohydrolase family protein [Candidatus Riflebacteria bacterium]